VPRGTWFSMHVHDFDFTPVDRGACFSHAYGIK
jgi:hypothetical protein